MEENKKTDKKRSYRVRFGFHKTKNVMSIQSRKTKFTWLVYW